MTSIKKEDGRNACPDDLSTKQAVPDPYWSKKAIFMARCNIMMIFKKTPHLSGPEVIVKVNTSKTYIEIL